ncbi:NRAMP family divalent metal transporter [Belliella pelovolcani]|uniref:NRAMP (Natural resistance-associated macrophage protein) metal ion transporters n=1 Tax=Belliella pelovolcani TaxID=529505 RepID=A0A1N7LSS3_9BACT|nr:divalent metal cation transporter [Belliella pelovolcani]SIS76890.1 NRAMP (natural resistance-associated macrophage protein) metal ion transporters [Belliella pelovolcani]
MSWRKYLGPGPLVAAAFVGPGTVTVCTLAGVNFGYELLWALALSIVATSVLQEMAARIGLITQQGLASVITFTLSKGLLRYFSLGIILFAIVLGNAAYEAGNISGGAMGMELFLTLPLLNFGQIQINLLNMSIGLIALSLLLWGNFQKITQVLTALVIMMSLAFLFTAIIMMPEIGKVAAGFVPRIDQSNIFSIVALIGTTVVPYNLFLHSSLISQKWQAVSDLKYIRVDTLVSVILGGLVSMAIVITAAGSDALSVSNAADLAKGLEMGVGVYAKYLIAFGLFAAGITSAITAPLAGSLVVCDIFGWPKSIQGKYMRGGILLILGLGLVFSSLGIKPVQLISAAQIANGILLPILSAYILWLVNKKSIMKNSVNNLSMNIIGGLIWLITFILGSWTVFRIFN